MSLNIEFSPDKLKFLQRFLLATSNNKVKNFKVFPYSQWFILFFGGILSSVLYLLAGAPFRFSSITSTQKMEQTGCSETSANKCNSLSNIQKPRRNKKIDVFMYSFERVLHKVVASNDSSLSSVCITSFSTLTQKFLFYFCVFLAFGVTSHSYILLRVVDTRHNIQAYAWNFKCFVISIPGWRIGTIYVVPAGKQPPVHIQWMRARTGRLGKEINHLPCQESNHHSLTFSLQPRHCSV